MSERPQEQVTEQPQQRRLAGRVAVVGFPNAGKSTLINRLTSSRQAAVLRLLLDLLLRLLAHPVPSYRLRISAISRSAVSR